MIQNQIKEQSLKVKMCGMRRKEDIAYANEVKPDAIGYIFFSFCFFSIATASSVKGIVR